ncbi:MAG: hypothetical protein HY331_05455 [Chloroflexi bacterium]|nr:hypothetical protein [Chloroflexota bacterium]
MAKVRLRGQQNDGTGEATESREGGGPVPLKPIDTSGVLVSKPALISALRVYVPQFVDIQVVDGPEEQFILKLGPAGDEER